jgi:hypothetical protein
MILNNTLEAVLNSPEPRARLREWVIEKSSKGTEKASILKLLEDTRIALRESGRDEEEDIVLDVMDFVVGWCSPHMKI